MKITVHWLTTDIRNCGTQTLLFGSRKALLDHAITEHVEPRLLATEGVIGLPDFELERENAASIKQALAEGNPELAWSLYSDPSGGDGVKDRDDYFWDGHQEVLTVTP